MTHTLVCELWLRQPRDRVFAFFADAHNLEAITPPWLHFTVLTPRPIRMQTGLLIDYRLKLHHIPLRWQSEITEWDPPFRFQDTQRRGPYRTWIHTHEFEEHDKGTLCRDRVEYAVPGGRLINALMVRRQVASIFRYRQEALTRLFAATEADSKGA